MRLRAFTIIATLCALAFVPSTALAAPKKVSFRFSATAYSVVEANTAFNVTVQRTGNTRVAASVRVSDQGTGTAVTSGPNPNYDAFTPQVLNFAAGETSKTVQVTIHDNTTFDPPNKTIVLLLDLATSIGSSPPGPKIATPTTTITILDNDGPGTIDFSSSAYSVVENAGVATVTVNRNSATNISESVDYTTTALPAGTGNATAGVDYMTSSGTLTFAAGEMSKTFQVPILDDTLYEGNEVLDLTLSNPQNLTNPASVPVLGPNNSVPATLTIVDDDVPIFNFSQPTYSVMENDGTATITVTRSGATNVAASIDYSDAGTGSAATPADYTLTGGTLAFAAGETTKTFTVGIINNVVGPEPNKTVGLQLTQGGVQVATATLSIVDDDDPMPSVQFSNVSYSVSETAASVTITATLSKAYDGDVTVNYATSDGTATAGAPMVNPDGSADYQATSGTLTFYGNIHNGGTGDVKKTFEVPINPDTVVEGDENFNVTLSGNSVNSTLGAPATAPVTIVDDDQAGSLEFTSLRYDVNETGGQATVTVRRVGGTGGPVSVDYATSDGSAQAPGDYATTTGTLNFGDGDTQKTFAVPVVWDGLAEGDETVNLALSNPGGGSDLGAKATAALHIADDGASGPVQFSATGYTVGEADGMATVTVTRTGGSLGGPVTVAYATFDGTATAGSDYGEMHGTLTFNAGETTKTFQVPVINDSVHEGDETVALTLSNPGGGTSLGSRASALLTIADDDPAADVPAMINSQGPAAKSNPPGVADKVAPKLTLSAKAIQRALKAKLVALSARCNEACTLKVTAKVGTGKKAIVLGRSTARAASGKNTRMTVKLSKKALASLRKALKSGKVTVVLAVTATDAAGNKAAGSRKVTVKA